MKLLYIGLFTLTVIKACGPSGEPEGGPCSYEMYTCKATVAEIFDADSTWKDVMFVVESNPMIEPGDDTIFYSRYFGSYISPEDIEKKGIKEGAAFKYIVGEIKTGSCSPTYRMLRMEPYAGEK